MAKDAMVDFLKFIFNILWRYPRMTDPEDKEDTKANTRVMGELWNDNLSKYASAIFFLKTKVERGFFFTVSFPLS